MWTVAAPQVQCRIAVKPQISGPSKSKSGSNKVDVTVSPGAPVKSLNGHKCHTRDTHFQTRTVNSSLVQSSQPQSWSSPVNNPNRDVMTHLTVIYLNFSLPAFLPKTFLRTPLTSSQVTLTVHRLSLITLLETECISFS
jgi:hypothetical protein